MKENRMGTERLSRLVLITGLPMILSLLINSTYNLVDSIFVSRLSENALTAVSLASPVQLFMSSLGFGIAVGLNAVTSKALGAKEPEKVKRAATASLFLAVCAWVLIVVIALLFLNRYFDWQAAGDDEIARYGRMYLGICMFFSFGQMFQWVFDRFVIASGKSGLFLYTLSAASVTNLILDPILIFGYFGIPAMGIKGAAVATVTGQCIGAVAGFLINKKFNTEIPILFSVKLDMQCVLEIIKIGLPSSFAQIITSAAGIVINSILIGFSSTAVAVYGICARLQGVVIVGTHGLNLGLIPIVAYNYGAGHKSRITGAVKWCTIMGLIAYIPFLFFMEVTPAAILKLFHAGNAMMKIGIPAVRIMGLAFLFSIFCLVYASCFQGLGLGTKSMLLNMIRQVILPLGLIVLLKSVVSVDGIWWLFVITEAVTIPIGIFMYHKVIRCMKI